MLWWARRLSRQRTWGLRVDPVTLYVEVVGLAPDADGQVRYRVELRAARNREGGPESGAVTWTEEGSATAVARFLVDLAAFPAGSGVHRLLMTIRDEVSGRSARVERVVKLR